MRLGLSTLILCRSPPLLPLLSQDTLFSSSVGPEYNLHAACPHAAPFRHRRRWWSRSRCRRLPPGARDPPRGLPPPREIPRAIQILTGGHSPFCILTRMQACLFLRPLKESHARCGLVRFIYRLAICCPIYCPIYCRKQPSPAHYCRAAPSCSHARVGVITWLSPKEPNHRPDQA